MNRHFHRLLPVVFLFAAWSWAAGFGCLCSLDGACGCGPECPDGTCGQCCSDDECDYPESCFSGYCSVDCDGEFCECCRDDVGCECCRDSDCEPTHYCELMAHESRWGFRRACVERCLQVEADCDRLDLSCCSELICAPDSLLCEVPCVADADCADREEWFAADLVCIDHLCRLVACQDELDCAEGQVCAGEACLSPLACDELAYCTLEPGHLRIQVGQRSQVTATAYLRDHELAPVDGFIWTSSDESVVEIGLEGNIAGVAEGGPVEVTAQVVGCDLTCSGLVEVFTP